MLILGKKRRLALASQALAASLLIAFGAASPLPARAQGGLPTLGDGSDLIPLCHPLALTRVAIEFEAASARTEGACGIFCSATVETVGQTGVEMEALTAVQIALLTIYDMCKAVDRGMTISGVRLMEKAGGKSGHFVR